jgi:hypothetical protein
MKSADHKGAIVNLFTKYSDVFCQGDSLICQTKLVNPSILALLDTKPIKHLIEITGKPDDTGQSVSIGDDKTTNNIITALDTGIG